MTLLAFIDTETTGLDPERHEIWEVALKTFQTESDPQLVKPIIDQVWQLQINESKADLIALNIGNYFNRRIYNPGLDVTGGTHFKVEFAKTFQSATIGAHLVGAVPSFDEERIRKILLNVGLCPAWHYHLVCVENLAAGKLGLAPPWKSDEISEKLGVDRSEFEKHTAMGDVDWAIAMYKAVML